MRHKENICEMQYISIDIWMSYGQENTTKKERKKKKTTTTTSIAQQHNVCYMWKLDRNNTVTHEHAIELACNCILILWHPMLNKRVRRRCVFVNIDELNVFCEMAVRDYWNEWRKNWRERERETQHEEKESYIRRIDLSIDEGQPFWLLLLSFTCLCSWFFDVMQ